MARTLVKRDDLPDGRSVLYYYDPETGQQDSITVGSAIDPIERATQAGQVSAAQTRALYDDPFYRENFLDPMNLSAREAAKDRAAALQNQAKQLEMQGRTAEANILNAKAMVELRKAELKQQGQLSNRGMDIQMRGQDIQNEQFGRGQQLSANLALGQMRGPGNAAQFIDTGRRLGTMGIQSTALGQIAAGGVAQGAFVPGASGKPISLADRMSGLLGAPSQSTIDQRDANDRGLAQQIYSRPGQLARGSLESLSPYERSYLGSYGEAQGYDDEAFTEAYKRAGIQQGRRY